MTENEKIEELERKVKSLQEINNEYLERIADLEVTINNDDCFRLKPHRDNIVTRSAIESLFENLDNIPVNEIESLIKKYQ